jgi:hypothetical protein
MPRTERIADTIALTGEVLPIRGWGFVPPIAANELMGVTVINTAAIRARRTDFFMEDLLFGRTCAHLERNWYPTLVLRKVVLKRRKGVFW